MGGGTLTAGPPDIPDGDNAEIESRSFLSRREASATGHTSETLTIQLTRRDLQSWAANELAFYGLDITRFSTVFLAQLLQLQSNRTTSIDQLMDEVQYLEGRRRSTHTVAADTFKHLPLKGLFKKHFMSDRFILKNIGLHFGLANQGNGNKAHDKLIARVFRDNQGDNERIINALEYGLFVEGFAERVKRGLTGEWIVFQKCEGQNYYLTIGLHGSGDRGSDAEIWTRILDAYEFDFPFLKNRASGNQ